MCTPKGYVSRAVLLPLVVASTAALSVFRSVKEILWDKEIFFICPQSQHFIMNISNIQKRWQNCKHLYTYVSSTFYNSYYFATLIILSFIHLCFHLLDGLTWQYSSINLGNFQKIIFPKRGLSQKRDAKWSSKVRRKLLSWNGTWLLSPNFLTCKKKKADDMINSLLCSFF